MIYIAVLAALAAGACFALGGFLQQREASTRPEDESLSLRLLIDLARQPAWLAGIGSTAGSFLFKAVALAFGPLTIVQPLIASELLFAIPPSVRRHRMRLHLREWSAILAIGAGLAIGIISAHPHQGDPLPSLLRWGEALGALALLAATALLIGRRVTGPTRAASYAIAAVALLAGQSALLAATVALFKRGIVTALTSWQPYAMGVVSILALTIVQSAYQAGPLAASMPVMNAGNPIVAITIGLVVFNETIATGTWHLLGAVLGVALLIGGILALTTSPVVHKAQRIEDAEQAEVQAELEAEAGHSPA
ncbi:MAG: DMT family transporter [Actinobacteria bacterium]|nr:DMT family transporter [Actinomycetota bacterium]